MVYSPFHLWDGGHLSTEIVAQKKTASLSESCLNTLMKLSADFVHDGLLHAMDGGFAPMHFDGHRHRGVFPAAKQKLHLIVCQAGECRV
jgi:hypothetical protein